MTVAEPVPIGDDRDAKSRSAPPPLARRDPSPPDRMPPALPCETRLQRTQSGRPEGANTARGRAVRITPRSPARSGSRRRSSRASRTPPRRLTFVAVLCPSAEADPRQRAVCPEIKREGTMVLRTPRWRPGAVCSSRFRSSLRRRAGDWSPSPRRIPGIWTPSLQFVAIKTAQRRQRRPPLRAATSHFAFMSAIPARVRLDQVIVSRLCDCSRRAYVRSSLATRSRYPAVCP